MSRYYRYEDKRERYVVYYDKKQFVYSVERYGEFAEELAKMALKDGKRYNDYFEHNDDNTTTFYINTKAYGIKKVLVDTEDAEKLYNTKISVAKDNHAHTFYASTKNGKLHRIITGVTETTEIVDHVDRNGLNNTKKNLRVVDVSTNNKNAGIRLDNKTGYKGILEDSTRFRLYYYDNDKKKHSKSFSKIKYGEEKAREMILEYRDMVYEQNNYIA